MTTGRFRRRNAPFRPTGERRTDRDNNFFLAMVGFSVAAHIIAAAVFSRHPAPPVLRRPPTIFIDLVAPPVANPQRGSAGATRKTASPVAVEKAPPLPTKAAKEAVALKGKEVKKTAEPAVDVAADIAKMKQRKAEQDEEKSAEAAIVAMRKKRTPAPTVAAAAGSASGTGDEAGSAIEEWLQGAVRSKWSWPDRKRKDLSAEVEVEFNVAGKLSNYRFIRSSTDARFDDSLKRALLSLEPLPKPLRKPFKETILFNLDELQGQ